MRRSCLVLPLSFSLISGLVATVVPARAQEETDAVTREEAIRLALERSPAAIGARGATRVAEAGLMEARGAWLPSLNANTGYSKSSNTRFDQSTGQLVSENYTAQLAASYDVFTGGRKLANWQSASASVRAAEARERGERYATILETTRIFYEAAADEELLAAARQRLERAQRQREFAETRRLLGTATRSDALRAELEQADAELAVLDAEAQLRTARLTLGRQIGRPGAVRPAAGALPEEPPSIPPVETLVARAEENAPLAVAGRAELDRAKSEKREAWGQYVPTLRLTGGYDRSAGPPTRRAGACGSPLRSRSSTASRARRTWRGRKPIGGSPRPRRGTPCWPPARPSRTRPAGSTPPRAGSTSPGGRWSSRARTCG
jgi:outer membrane protein TolC